MAAPAKSDQVFSLVAVEGGLPLIVGILFVVGLISSTYSAAGSALTALTTSFTVDMLEGTKRYGDARLTRIRRGVHVADVHASEGPRPLDAAGGPRGPGIECAGAVVGAEDLGLSDWLRTVDLQCRLYDDRYAVACEML